MHDAAAAVVAAQLLAFAREPVRYRPRLTHGREVFDGGLWIFRFAQARFPHALLRDIPHADRARVRDAAEAFIRQVCLWDGATHYQVLCLAPGARRELVKEHYHALIALLHPDRAESPWPADAAQRVNAAYAVLSHDERRREYDAGLHRAPHGSSMLDQVLAQSQATGMHAPPRRGLASRLRRRRQALVLASVVALLFFASMWAAEYTSLEGVQPFDASSRLARDAWNSAGPRFLRIGNELPATDAAQPLPEGIPYLAPLWRAITAPPWRGASDGGLRLADPPVLQAAPAAPAIPAVQAPPRAAAPVKAAASPSMALAQTQPPPAPAAPNPSSISTDALETLIARLVTYYESGDLERFLALQDAPSLGVWEALRMRQEFQDFFRATRLRRLKLQRVALEADGSSGRARGEAEVSAEFVEDSSRLQRSVRIEIDVVARGGELRIARLSLFPHGG